MAHSDLEPRFDVAYDNIVELERQARRERDRYIAACLGAAFRRVKGGISTLIESLPARPGTAREA